MREQIIAAGFDAGHAFAEHQRFAGGNVSYIFGAQA
jgi:hypothetical protein